jgi:hypothetical protein
MHRTRRVIGAHGTIEIVRGEPVTCNGSIFTTQLAFPVSSVAAANAAIAVMRLESHCSVADHNMTAFRIGGASKKAKVEKAYDDDGEAHGGQRLLGFLTKNGVCNVAVVASRVYGGQNIGKRRFELICETTATLLQFLGHQPGRGIEHSWGDGHVLGGEALSSPSSSASAAASSGGKKRKRDVAATAAEDQRRAQREAAALAAERRMSGQQQQQ